MKEANFPLFAANLRGADDKLLEGFKESIIIDVGGAKLMANDVMAYITAKKAIAPKVEGRIRIKM